VDNIHLTYVEIHQLCQILATQILNYPGSKNFRSIVPVARGGLIPAILISRFTNIPLQHGYITYAKDTNTLSFPENLYSPTETLIIDDILDTGHMYTILKNVGMQHFAALYCRHSSTEHLHSIGSTSTFTGAIVLHDDWLVFPWEVNDSAHAIQ
jgi:hypoxanthine phosphoribosyltransferase